MPRGPRRYLRLVAVEDVAPDRVHIDRELTDGLARIEHVEDAEPPAQRADGFGRVDQSAVRRCMGQRHHHRAGTELPLEVRERDLPVLVVVDEDDLDAEPATQLQQPDRVARVLRPCRQHSITAPEREAVDGHVPGAGGVLDDRDVIGVGIEQRRQRRVDTIEAGGSLTCGLVAADLGFPPDVSYHGLDRGCGRQRASGIVEMNDVVRAGSVGTDRVEPFRVEPFRWVRIHCIPG